MDRLVLDPSPALRDLPSARSYRNRLTQLCRSDSRQDYPMRLSEATTHFTRQLAANGCSVHTQKAYARDLGAFARWFGRDAALSAIKPDDLTRFLISDAVLLTPDGQPRKPIKINRTKSALRSFFAICVESG